MNLKKLFVAFVLLATTAIAGAQNSNKYVISTEPLSVISAGTVDDKIVNQARMTGKAVRLMLDKMLYERAGISLNQLVTEGTKSPITEAHYNTQATTGGIEVYWDRTLEGEAWEWKGRKLIKDECCNMIGNDRQILLDFLANYAKQGSQNSEAYKIGNPPTDDGDTSESSSDSKEKKQTDKNDNNMSAATPDYTWIIFGGIVLAFFALLAYFSRRNNHTNTTVHHSLDSTVGSSTNQFLQNMREVHTVEDTIRRRIRQNRESDIDELEDQNYDLYAESNRQQRRWRNGENLTNSQRSNVDSSDSNPNP